MGNNKVCPVASFHYSPNHPVIEKNTQSKMALPIQDQFLLFSFRNNEPYLSGFTLQKKRRRYCSVFLSVPGSQRKERPASHILKTSLPLLKESISYRLPL